MATANVPVFVGGNQVVGKVMILYGTVKAIAPDGTVRLLAPNSPIFANDRIVTEGDGSISLMMDSMPPSQMDLGRMSSVLIDEDVYAGVTPHAVSDAAAEAEQIQQALLAGDAPIEFEAAAAGGDVSAGGNHPLYVVGLTGAEVTPTSGAGTIGVSYGTVNPLDAVSGQQPATVAAAVAVINTISITAPDSVPEGSQFNYTATLTHAAQGDISVVLSNGAHIDIPAGASSGTVTVSAPPDNVYITPGTVTATITGANGGGTDTLVINPAPAVTAITDTINTTTVTLSAPAVVMEGDKFVYTATVDNAPEGNLVITLNDAAHTTITILNGQLSGTSESVTAPNVPDGGGHATVGIAATTGGNYENLDTGSTVQQTINDHTPTLPVNDTVTVYESALPGIGSGAEGSGHSHMASGTFADNATWNADGFGGIVSVNGVAPVNGIITITDAAWMLKVDAGTGAYIFTLLSNVLANPSGNNGANIEAMPSFAVVGQDADGSKIGFNLNVNIVDDTPTAMADGPYSVTEDAAANMLSGNVLTNDLPGADAPASFIAWGNSAADSAAIADLAKYGTLHLNSDGTWSFALNNSLAAVQALTSESTITKVINYTMQDADGDQSSANLTIIIHGADDSANVTTAAISGPDATVYEHGLVAGDHSNIFSGTFTVSATDGIHDINVGGTSITADQLNNLGTANVSIQTGEGTLLLTGYDSGTGVVHYTYTLTSAIDNTKPAEPGDAVTLDHYDDNITIAVNGIGGTTASDTLMVRIIDDVPTVHFADASGPDTETHFAGLWSADIGADAIPKMTDYVKGIVLNSVQVDGSSATFNTSTFTYDSATSTYSGSFTYNGTTTVPFTLTLVDANNYTLDLGKALTSVIITPNEYAGAVHAAGPTDTYIITYHDTTTGSNVTATASVVTGTSPITLYALDHGGSYTATLTGSLVNASGDGIGIDNNVISSFVGHDNVLTAESLKYMPQYDASAVTLNFKASGDVGFGTGGSEDVVYIKAVTGSVSHTIMLDSQHGDFLVNSDGSLTAITAPVNGSDYTGGSLASYVINSGLWHGTELIDYITVTAGFYSDSHGIHGSDVKVSLGFATETTTTFNLPMDMNFTTTVTDADGDLASSTFNVQSVAGTTLSAAFVGSASIVGTAGDDTLHGTAGSDTFKATAGHDHITDYHKGGSEHDVVDISGLVANATQGNLHVSDDHGHARLTITDGGVEKGSITFDNISSADAPDLNSLLGHVDVKDGTHHLS